MFSLPIRLSSWTEAQQSCEALNMVLSNEDNILSSHLRTAAEFGDLAFIGLKRNNKVRFILGT